MSSGKKQSPCEPQAERHTHKQKARSPGNTHVNNRYCEWNLESKENKTKHNSRLRELVGSGKTEHQAYFSGLDKCTREAARPLGSTHTQ